MRTQTVNQILTAIITTLILISDVNASQDCGLNPKALQDGKDLAKFLVEQTTGDVDSTHSLAVGTQLKINAQNSANQEIKKLANEGVLANVAVHSFKNFRGQAISYGSVVAVSPCHAITNLHVPEGLTAVSACKSSSNPKACYKNLKLTDANVINKEYIGSFPRSCGSESEVRKYKVVAHVPQNKITEKGKTYIPIEKDFAVLKTSQPLASGRVYAELSEASPSEDQYALSVGEGFDDLDSDEYDLTRVSVGSVFANNQKSAGIKGVKSATGKSGSGIYSLRKGKIRNVGFMVNRVQAFVTWESILEYLDATDKALLKEIMDANETGICR